VDRHTESMDSGAGTSTLMAVDSTVDRYYGGYMDHVLRTDTAVWVDAGTRTPLHWQEVRGHVQPAPCGRHAVTGVIALVGACQDRRVITGGPTPGQVYAPCARTGTCAAWGARTGTIPHLWIWTCCGQA
jgi:hypothetical protein